MNLSDAELRLRCVELILTNAQNLSANGGVVGGANEIYNYITNGIPEEEPTNEAK